MMKLSVQKLAKLMNPFEDDIWNVDGVLDRKIIAECIEKKQFIKRPHPCGIYCGCPRTPAQRLTYHHKRVAYLVVHGWRDGIEVDLLAFPKFEMWITDGGHRLAAAMYLNRETIGVRLKHPEIGGQSVALIKKKFQ